MAGGTPVLLSVLDTLFVTACVIVLVYGSLVVESYGTAGA